MIPRTLFVLSLLVLIAGCSRPLQRPERTFTVAPPKVWQGGETIPSDDGVDWWAYFGDRGLDNALTRALTFNQDLRAAAARVSAAEAEARIAGAALRPSADLSLNRSRQRQNFVGLPIPGREGSVLSTTYSSAGVSLGISWEPDVWGRINAGKLAAIAATQVRQADLVAARLSLTGQVTKAWFAAIEAQRQVGLARASLQSYETSAERVRERFQRGLRPSLDLRLALTEIQLGEALLQQRQEQLRRGIRQLEILLGDYPKGEHDLAEDLPRVPEAVPAGLPSELVHRRPDLVSVERELLGADARIQQSKADLRPRFSLTAAGGTASSSLTDLLDGTFLAWSLIGGLTQPIYDRSRLKTAVKRDEARAREIAARYESAILRAYGEVESALASESALAGREKALEAATKLSLGARDEAERRYRAGLADIITVLSTQRIALDSESQLLTVRRQRLDNRVDLHLAIGGGFATNDLPRDNPQAKQTRTQEVSGL